MIAGSPRSYCCVCIFLLINFPLFIKYTNLNSSATGNASTKGASSTVNGYMAFVLYSVAGLACKLSSPRSQCLTHISHSCPFLWGNLVPIGPSICRRVMELLRRYLTFNNDFLCSRTCHDISVMPSLSFDFIYSLFASERSRQVELLSANDFAYPIC